MDRTGALVEIAEYRFPMAERTPLTKSRRTSETYQHFRRLLLAELDALYRTARYLTRDATLAEDLVHDVVVKALEKHQGFRQGAALRPWLFAILRNTVVDYYRRHGREVSSLDIDDHQDAIPDNVSVDERVLDGVLDEEIEEALAQLPEDMRLAVLLADVEEMSYKEIASVLGWPLGTVMSRIHRGRQKLRAALKDLARRRGFGQ